MSQASVTELYQDDDQRGAKRGRLRHEPGKHIANFRRRKFLRKVSFPFLKETFYGSITPRVMMICSHSLQQRHHL